MNEHIIPEEQREEYAFFLEISDFALQEGKLQLALDAQKQLIQIIHVPGHNHHYMITEKGYFLFRPSTKRCPILHI